jgi:hypothetical protein
MTIALLWRSSSQQTANQPEFMGLTFKRALNEQLGLSLKPTIAPVDFFAVSQTAWVLSPRSTYLQS